jgi:class 3 adenylate cyclase/tetratricopeptide (TPR) repeat protein
MRCSKCGSDNRETRKFCSQCGTPLATKCPRCGASNEPGERFCGDCGAALITTQPGTVQSSTAAVVGSDIQIAPEQADPSLASDGERKTVTALFADIKGSMELIENLDPEEAQAIVDPALKLMMDAVDHYGGYVAQSTGDGIFALFGAPVAHEDHPQRALHAALRMQGDMRRYSAKLRAAGNPPIEARVGVNTGEVVVRSITIGEGHAEYTPIGHSTSLAARMQVLAPTGSIATTDATRRLTEGYFTFKLLGPAVVKGVSESVEVYEVIGLGPLRTRLQRAAGRGLTKFVGRRREIEAMKHAAELARTGHGQIVAAVADPGVGKSRLFYEFKPVCQSDWTVLEAYSVSYGKASAYLPVLELLRAYFRIVPEDGRRQQREKAIGKILGLDRALEDSLPYVFTLMGMHEAADPLAQMDGQIRRRRTHEALKRIFLRESLNRPLILIFEDLHWVDGETQAILEVLADSLANARILLLVNYRPEYRHEWGNRTYYTQLRLDPLATENTAEMLSELLGDAPELRSLKHMIAERTEGNPFFIEEIIQALSDEGALVRNGTVKVMRPVAQIRLPPTVQGMLAARVDRLPPAEKELLQTLSVIGKQFTLKLAREVAGQPEEELARMLGHLQLGEFVYEQPAMGDAEYEFKHALTQEVAYNSVLTERRKLLHERAGQALEAMFQEHLDDRLGELAQHYSRSSNLTKAVDYLCRAGEQLSRRSAFQEAMLQLNQALEFVGKLPPGPGRDSQELSVRLALLGPMLATRLFFTDEESRANLERARVLCGAASDSMGSARVLFSLTYMYWSGGNLRTAGQLVGELRLLAERKSDDALLVFRANGLAGLVDAWMGRLRSGLGHAERALEINEDLVIGAGEGGWLASCRAGAGWLLWMLGYPDQLLGYETHLSDLLSKPIDLFSRAGIFQSVLASHCHFLRDYRGMRELAESLIALSRENGFPYWLGCGLVRLGRIQVEDGDIDAGIETMLEGMRTFRAVSMALTYDYFCCVLAEAYLAAGRVEEGLAVLNEAIARSAAQQQRFCEPELHRLKGELLRLSGAADDAEKSMREAIAIAQGQEAKSWELRATTSLARLLEKQGRRGEARTMLAEIYGWFTEGFDTADLKVAKALLDRLNA